MQDLPITSYRSDLLFAIQEYPTLIIVGETGSGKTTQIPRFIAESLESVKRIAITQPRRIAVMSAAKRVSEEMTSPLGGTVGYCIRFEKIMSIDTRILFMTDGTLLRLCISDPLLKDYDIVILDEAHERSLETDILFGLLRRAQRARNDLKVLIMSATLDIEKFQAFFGDCPVFCIPGRLHPVEIFWQSKIKFSTLKSSYVQRSVETALHIHQTEPPGDVLVFLTGQQEIESAIRQMEQEQDLLTTSHPQVKGMILYPIYSSLETLEQRAIFDPPPLGLRKIIFSTNISQTSLTIPGIRYVIDSGFVKQKMYDPKTHMDALVVLPISQSAATQRAGRAGRIAQGKVYRLYSRDAFAEMAPDTIPEIQRSSLIGTVLNLKKIGIEDVLNFEFIDSPNPELLIAAIKDLFLLGAVDEHGHLTLVGKQLAEFPISPFLSRALISSCLDFDCSQEMVRIVSMMSCEDVYITPRSKKKVALADEAKRKFMDSTGDHLTLLNIYTAWETHNYSKEWSFDHFLHYRALLSGQRIKAQLLEVLKKLKLPLVSCKSTRKNKRDPLPILNALTSAFYVHTAKKHPQRSCYYPYLSSIGSSGSSDLFALFLNPQSTLSQLDSEPEWVLYNDIQYVNRAHMRTVSKIDFSLVQLLIGRVKLMDETKLMGSHLHLESSKPEWASNEEELQVVEGSSSESLHFDMVQEVIDEQHHKESLHTKDGDVPFIPKTLPDIQDIQRQEQEALECKERQDKIAAYKQRYLKRKR